MQLRALLSFMPMLSTTCLSTCCGVWPSVLAARITARTRAAQLSSFAAVGSAATCTGALTSTIAVSAAGWTGCEARLGMTHSVLGFSPTRRTQLGSRLLLTLLGSGKPSSARRAAYFSKLHIMASIACSLLIICTTFCVCVNNVNLAHC